MSEETQPLRKTVTDYFSQLGKKAKGAAKRRDPAHYRRLVEIRAANRAKKNAP